MRDGLEYAGDPVAPKEEPCCSSVRRSRKLHELSVVRPYADGRRVASALEGVELRKRSVTLE